MSKYKNDKGVSLSVAVWLANDTYDYNPDPNTISVTTLIKPLKQIILGARASGTGVVDPEEISNLVASRMGTAFHDSIEQAWLGNYKESLLDLGYPKRVVEAIRVNPEEDDEDTIPIYLEKRAEKKAGPLTVSGKFDIVIDGRVEDFKSTGTYAYTKGNKDATYVLQGSLYRWLNPDIITEDTMAIQFIFTDWKPTEALSNSSYPQNRVLEHKLQLMSLMETEHYVTTKVNNIIRLMDADESELPDCTPDELWQDKPSYKYYKNPAKTARSTKNFDNILDANVRLAQDGNVGIVKTVPGSVKACKYCNARNLCKQKDAYIANGLLKL